MTPREKALEINLNDQIYGTFAEIGAGQEVARHFFRAGGAAGTIAKTISAYDMAMSDAIYGKDAQGRYVSEGRLVKMLQREFDQLIERLGPGRPESTRFFAFADTVAAKSYKGNNECHGWMGVRFQHAPKAPPSEVVVHVRMLDNQNVLQQEAIGIIGVNLVHACYYDCKDVATFVSSMMDGLIPQRLEIDMIRVSGPAFEGHDPRLLSLELVKKKYSQAVMFGHDGGTLQPSDVLYRKNVAILRGSFRPPTLLNMDMLESGLKAFKETLTPEEQEQVLVLPEISMGRLLERGEVDNADFLARVDLLGQLGHRVLISSKDSFPDLNQYLLGLTKKQVAFIAGVYNLEDLFKSRPESPIVARIGDLFTGRTRFYVYPAEKTPGVHTPLAEMDVPEAERPLLSYLIAKKHLNDIAPENVRATKIWSREVLSMIQKGTPGWEVMLPPVVAKTVKAKKLFGYKGEA